MTHFSDSIILSWPRPSSRGGLVEILTSLAGRVRSLFLHRLLVRGGVVQGKIFHRWLRRITSSQESPQLPRVIVAESILRGCRLPHIRVDGDGIPACWTRCYGSFVKSRILLHLE